MKKLLVVLLSLGLIAVFCAPAAAVEVKLSGEWYTYGIYYNNRLVQDDSLRTSRAWIYTQTRLAPVFQITDALRLTMRADMLSKFWGGTNWRGGTDDKTSSRKQEDIQNAAGAIADTKIQENIEVERSFLTANTDWGVLSVGYMASGTFGPDFGNDGQTRPRIRYSTKVGPVTVLAVYEKQFESDHADGNARLGEFTDADNQNYNIAGVYGFEGGEVGVLYKYVANNSNRPVGGFKTKVHAIDPYVTMQIGPVEIEAEFMYQFGKNAEFDVAPAAPGGDIDKKGWGGFVKAKASFGAAYFGGMLLYATGDDPATPLEDESGPVSPDAAYGYIMAKDYEDSDTNPQSADGLVEVDDSLNNMTMLQLYAGFDPTEKLNLQVQFLWAKENEDRFILPVGVQQSNDIGYEFGAEANYKIFDNLSYKVAAAYFWAGDIFKGANPLATVGNDYMLYNKLTLEW